MIEASRAFKWYGMLGVLLGLIACVDADSPGSKDAAVTRSLQRHVLTSLQSLDPAKLKDLGFAPPHDIVHKKFEKEYEVRVIKLTREEDASLRGRVHLTGSMLDPRSELWLTEVVHLNFVRLHGQDEWKLITYRGQIEDYLSQAIPGKTITPLPDAIQTYLKSAFTLLPAEELKTASD